MVLFYIRTISGYFYISLLFLKFFLLLSLYDRFSQLLLFLISKVMCLPPNEYTKPTVHTTEAPQLEVQVAHPPESFKEESQSFLGLSLYVGRYLGF